MEASYAQQSSPVASTSSSCSPSTSPLCSIPRHHHFLLDHPSCDIVRRLVSGSSRGDELVSLLLLHGLHPSSSCDDMQLAVLSHITSGACFSNHDAVGCHHAFAHVVPRVVSGSLSRAELASLLEVHGIVPNDNFSCDDMQLTFLSHIFSGTCFFKPDSPGCAATCRSRGSTVSQYITSTLSDVLLSEPPWTTRELSVLCKALGSPATLNVRKACVNYLETYRSSFSSSWSPALIVEDIFKLSAVSLRACCNCHGVSFQEKDSLETLRSRIIHHLCMDGCQMLEERRGLAVCRKNTPLWTTLLIGLMNDILLRRAQARPLKRVLTTLNIPFPVNATFRDLRNIVRGELESLRRGKRVSDRCEAKTAKRDLKLFPPLQSVEERAECWPQVVTDSLKEKVLTDFLDETSSAALSESVCAVCGESKVSSKMHLGSVNLDEIEVPLLTRPHSHIPNPCPVAQHAGRFLALEAMYLDWNGIHLPDDCNNEIRLNVCIDCYGPLVTKNKIPPCALANGLFLGQVPPELKDLTVVEEALIARRRAKAWIVHLQESADEDEDGRRPANVNIPPRQRAMKGHVITYPSKPEKVSPFLPSSLESVSSLMCVVFVGSKAPTKEWLKTKAKPLVVRREKVRKALLWLRQNNDLYRDIKFNEDVLQSLPVEDILPVEVHVEQPNAANEAQGGRYDSGVNASCECEKTCTCRPSEAVLQSLVITDLDNINVSSSQMKAAALKHLKSGKGFLEVQHEPDPVNEYEDELLFPLLYPTLFPYGTGGFEAKDCPVRLSMKRQAKHFFNLRDSRFREHYSFLFTTFNILQ